MLLLGAVVTLLVFLDHQVIANTEVMTNQWLVRLHDDLGSDAAKLVAKRNGFSYVSPVSIIYHIYIYVRIHTYNMRRRYLCIRKSLLLSLKDNRY